ncbi:hypothetical protein M9H77_27126 [Catharanthus roseus]|uniref:Uncharacterized protein n=1 Tax=Catharanthus roseus TaxID=4058 RepID=A0ACC0ABM7_CATRO|nr:hypothetical protein M9H77_27126 [Catharanthus roseus]
MEKKERFNGKKRVEESVSKRKKRTVKRNLNIEAESDKQKSPVEIRDKEIREEEEETKKEKEKVNTEKEKVNTEKEKLSTEEKIEKNNKEEKLSKVWKCIKRYKRGLMIWSKLYMTLVRP